MGKATNPAAARKGRIGATKEQRQRGNVARINGIDVNHGASPLTRWKADGSLSPAQLAAIGYCQRIWALIGAEARTTASYGERTSAATAEGESGKMILSRMRAKDELTKIAGGMHRGEFRLGYVPRGMWAVFENCIRYDEPAGAIGSKLGRSAPSVRALTTVQNTASMIAHHERLFLKGEE